MGLIAKLLGKDLTKWARLKIATGVTSDEDLLIKLIYFYAEANDISLTEPQLPVPLRSGPPAALGTRKVTVRVRPKVEPIEPEPDVPQMSYVVIHQGDRSQLTSQPGPGLKTGWDAAERDPFLVPDDGPEDSAATDHEEASPNFTMLMLREEEVDAGEADDPADDDYQPQLRDLPIAKTPRVYYREEARPRGWRRFVPQEHSRQVEGMLWREAVLLGVPMPLSDVKLVTNSSWPEPVEPTPLPWSEDDETPPVQEVPSEEVLLKECCCALCGRAGFGSRLEYVTHFWLQHPETRQRQPTSYLGSKHDPDHAHCALCLMVGAVAEGAKHNKLVPHVTRAHADCRAASHAAPHVCDTCHAESPTAGEHDRHVAEAHSTCPVLDSFCCVVCTETLVGEQAYIRHLRIHYTEHVYACNVCPNFRSCDPAALAAHAETHDRRVMSCRRCPLRTRTFRTLVDHVRGHLQLPSHVCPICGYRAYTSSRYFNHLDSHGGRRHTCETCGEQFTSLLKKSAHKIQVHRRPAKFTCNICDITFKSSFRLKRHQASHTGVKPVACELCGKGLSSNQALRNHMRVCPENDPYNMHNIVEIMAT